MAITFITSIPALLLYHPILHDHNYILGAGHDTRIEFAAVLEVFLMISGIGVAIVMFPILRRESERLALGYVASRIVESAMIGVGILCVLAIVTLRGDWRRPWTAMAGRLRPSVAHSSRSTNGRWSSDQASVSGSTTSSLGYLMYGPP